MGNVNRERVLEASVTALALLSVALVAAAFERAAPTFAIRRDFGETGGAPRPGLELGVQCPAPLGEWRAVLALAGVLVVLGVLALRRGHSPAVPVVVTVAPLVAVLALCPVRVPVPATGTGFGGPQVPLTGTQVLFGLLAVAGVLHVAAGAWFWYRMTGNRRVSGEGPDLDDDDALSALGDAAGAAADSIEEPTAAENEVYRAWRRMTAALDVDEPTSSTPEDFAEAAVDAGMDPEHVARLTDLFRDVRYGGKDADEREEHAVEVLRQIERAYGGDER